MQDYFAEVPRERPAPHQISMYKVDEHANHADVAMREQIYTTLGIAPEDVVVTDKGQHYWRHGDELHKIIHQVCFTLLATTSRARRGAAAPGENAL